MMCERQIAGSTGMKWQAPIKQEKAGLLAGYGRHYLTIQVAPDLRRSAVSMAQTGEPVR